MHWLYLSLAILFEVAGTLNMKLSEGSANQRPASCWWYSIFAA